MRDTRIPPAFWLLPLGLLTLAFFYPGIALLVGAALTLLLFKKKG